MICHFIILLFHKIAQIPNEDILLEIIPVEA